MQSYLMDYIDVIGPIFLTGLSQIRAKVFFQKLCRVQAQPGLCRDGVPFVTCGARAGFAVLMATCPRGALLGLLATRFEYSCSCCYGHAPYLQTTYRIFNESHDIIMTVWMQITYKSGQRQGHNV